MDMYGRTKLGIIGAGRIGKLHAENIISHIKNAELKAVSDLFPEKLEEWAASMKISRLTNDYKEIINDKEIEAVLICSSTDTHAHISVEAVAAGKHVFCEKPVDMDADVIRGVIKAVSEAGVKYQVGFNRRFDPNFKRARDLVRDGKVGQVHIIKITSRDPSPPTMDYVKVSGGMFMDMTVHDFDMARYLAGSEVTEVFAAGAVLIDKEIGRLGDIDTAAVLLKFENGAMGVIDNSRKAVYGYDQRIEVFGSEGCVTVSNVTDSLAMVSRSDGVWSEKPKYFFIERYRESYIKEIEAFIECIRHNREVPSSGTDGLVAVLLGKAAQESLCLGRPVRLS